MLTYADVCVRMLLIPSEADANTLRGCYYYGKELLLVPQEASLHALAGCYYYGKELLVVPQEAASTWNGSY